MANAKKPRGGAASSRSTKADLQLQIDALRKDLQQANEAQADAQQRVGVLMAARDEAEKAAQGTRERLAQEHRANFDALNATLEGLRTQLAESRQAKAAAERDAVELNVKRSNLESRVRRLEEEVKTSRETAAEEARREAREAAERLHNDLKRARDEIDRLHRHKADADRERSGGSARAAEQESRIRALELELEEAKADSAGAADLQREQEKRIKEFQAAAESRREEADGLQDELEEARSEAEEHKLARQVVQTQVSKLQEELDAVRKRFIEGEEVHDEKEPEEIAALQKLLDEAESAREAAEQRASQLSSKLAEVETEKLATDSAAVEGPVAAPRDSTPDPDASTSAAVADLEAEREAVRVNVSQEYQETITKLQDEIESQRLKLREIEERRDPAHETTKFALSPESAPVPPEAGTPKPEEIEQALKEGFNPELTLLRKYKEETEPKVKELSAKVAELRRQVMFSAHPNLLMMGLGMLLLAFGGGLALAYLPRYGVRPEAEVLFPGSREMIQGSITILAYAFVILGALQVLRGALHRDAIQAHCKNCNLEVAALDRVIGIKCLKCSRYIRIKRFNLAASIVLWAILSGLLVWYAAVLRHHGVW